MKGQNFASQVLSRYYFRISRKKGSDFFDHRGTLSNEVLYHHIRWPTLVYFFKKSLCEVNIRLSVLDSQEVFIVFFFLQSVESNDLCRLV